MSAHTSLLSPLKDPPPAWAFELTEAGIAAAEISSTPNISFAELPPDAISPSPLRDNVVRPDVVLAQIRALAPGDGGRKRRRAALILPDYAVRVTVLDFDDFPFDAKEQNSLVRFRLKRSVPFDVDAAALSFEARKSTGEGRKWRVTAALAPLEIVARYEAPFRLAGFHPGWVTTSALAALDLVPATGVKVLVKRTGRKLSLAVVGDGGLDLIRVIELTEASHEELADHLFPTLAYIEDHLSSKPDTLLMCGFGRGTAELGAWLASEMGVQVEPLTSRLGAPGETNAGLLGYLEGLKER